MRTRARKEEPDPEDATHSASAIRQRKPKRLPRGRFFHGNKATCSRLKAVTAFYKVKDWVELNEPEFFEAFQQRSKPKRKGKGKV